MSYFIDERGPLVTIPKSLLIREYAQKIFSHEIDPEETSFRDYVRNCSETSGGTLSETPKPIFRVLVRETLVRPVNVMADNMESAIDKAYNDVYSGKITLNDGDYAGMEYLPCCSMCGSDFESVTDLRSAFGGALMLCDRCLTKLRKEYGWEECK